MKQSCSTKELENCGAICYKLIKPALLDSSELRQQIEQYKEKYHDVDKKLEEMQLIAIRQDSVVNYQSHQLKKRIIEVEKYEKSVKDKDDQIIKLISELNDINIKNKREIENKDSQIKALENKIVENDKENKLKHELKDNQINKLKTELKEKNNLLESTTNNITLLENRCETSAVEVKNKVNEISSLKSDLQSRDVQISEYKQKVEECSAGSCLPFGDSTDLHAFLIPGLDPFVAPCDSQVAGPGWMVFQRRIDGSVDFKRNWEDYKQGFGNVNGELWLGLERLHKLTTGRRYELLVHMETKNNIIYDVKYDNFEIGSEVDQYRLISLGSATGTGNDYLIQHEGMGFTTLDRDNDENDATNTAITFNSAWWYKYDTKR